MNESELLRLNRLGSQLELLYRTLHIDPYNAPTNREQEKAKLFAAYAHGLVYEPQFAYASIPPDWDLSLREFFGTNLQAQRTSWDSLLRLDAERMLEALEVTSARDPDAITQHTVKLHGPIAPELIAVAYEVLSTTENAVEARTVSAQDAAEVLRVGLLKVGLIDWEVIVDPAMVAKMNVRSVEKQVRVRDGEFFAPEDIQRLLVHEIGTHVFRAVNGENQPLRILRMGLAGYMTTEEGMATFHEERYHLTSNKDRRLYALRVLAAHMSLSQGFFEVFAHILKFTNQDEAFSIVQRAKRGFLNTGRPGSHVKDKIYLEGFTKVSAHLKNYPNHYRYLMSGKVSIDMIPMLQTLEANGLLSPPRCVPEMLLV